MQHLSEEEFLNKLIDIWLSTFRVPHNVNMVEGLKNIMIRFRKWQPGEGE